MPDEHDLLEIGVDHAMADYDAMVSREPDPEARAVLAYNREKVEATVRDALAQRIAAEARDLCDGRVH